MIHMPNRLTRQHANHAFAINANAQIQFTRLKTDVMCAIWDEILVLASIEFYDSIQDNSFLAILASRRCNNLPGNILRATASKYALRVT